MVRRVLWEHEIVGSSPATPTIPPPLSMAIDAQVPLTDRRGTRRKRDSGRSKSATGNLRVAREEPLIIFRTDRWGAAERTVPPHPKPASAS